MRPPRVPVAVPEALLLSALVFAPLAFGATEAWSRAILEALLFSLAAATFLSRRGGRGEPGPFLTDKTLLPAVLALWALGAAQWLNFRPYQFPAVWAPFTVSRADTGRALLLWAAYACLLWSAPRVLARPDARRRLLWTIFGLGALIAVIGIAQQGQGNTAYYGLRHVRWGDPFGPFANRDHGAAFLVMCAFTGAGLFASRLSQISRLRTLGQKSDLAASQTAVLFLLGVVLAGVLAAKSRGAFNSLFLSAGLAGAYWLWRARRAARLWAAPALLAAVLGYALFLIRHPIYFGNLTGTPDSSTAWRLSMYRSGLRLLADFPLWGVGLGAVRRVFPAYQDPLVVGQVLHVHSDWLEAALELGLAGIALLAAGLTAFAAGALRRLSAEPSRSARLISTGLLCAAGSFLLHEAVDFPGAIPGDACLAVVIAGALP